jgi:hypothetical protein
MVPESEASEILRVMQFAVLGSSAQEEAELGMLSLYRRHLKSCAHRDEGREYRRCRCPVWVDGTVGNQEILKSLGLRDWQKAQEKI